MFGLYKAALKIAPEKKILVYCWRGGLRSNILAWLLQTSGFRVTLLKGGYKSFRNWALATINESKKVIVIGGKTGCGKTEILNHLKKNRNRLLIWKNLLRTEALRLEVLDCQSSHLMNSLKIY
ncbi:MAG: hypothetical protein IPJ79_10675 [Bacteroidetes bacterium]|nr:hypothetical protein [Bacteroidota bacterium]